MTVNSSEFVVNSSELIREAKKRITQNDAEYLLAHLLDAPRAELYIYPAPSYCYRNTKEVGRGGVYEDNISDEIINKFNILVNERAEGKPLQYIIGKTEFMGLEFIVTPDVFIPRPETELLVEAVIDLVKSMNYELSTINLLDLGTGSGNIAISLTKFITDCKIISSDVSAQALCIARKNASSNLVDEVDKRIQFVLSDLFEKLPRMEFDMIVSNPPYVASSQIARLSKEISFEPWIALDGGADGLAFYRRIVRTAPKFLRKKGFLLLESGFDQAQELKELFEDADFKNIRFIKDYNNINRVVVAQWIN